MLCSYFCQFCALHLVKIRASQKHHIRFDADISKRYDNVEVKAYNIIYFYYCK